MLNLKNQNDVPILIHLELINKWCDEEAQKILMKHGDTTEKGTIVRDILIPQDMPLHNLHYTIQRLFGWQNSHLRSFQLDESDDLIMQPVTHKLIYNYDFGDNWIIEITRFNDLRNLIDTESIDKDWLEEAIGIVKNKHKPVCIYKKGGYVMDDVGGMSGYTDFLRTIYRSDDVEERKESRAWAKGMGWNNRKIELKKML